jgi:hypothetical protein
VTRRTRSLLIAAACSPFVIAAGWFLFIWRGANETILGLMALAMAIMVARLSLTGWLETREDRRRHRLGLCAFCGFDLRASTQRCPECGRAIPPPDIKYPGEAEATAKR